MNNNCGWNEHVPFTFCEGKYNNNWPINGIEEFGNSVSSFFLTAFGIFGLYGSVYTGPIIQNLYSALVVNGVGSVLFHATLKRGFKFIDEIPMVIMMAYGNTILFDELFYKFIKTPGSVLSEKKGYTTLVPHHRYLYAILSNSITLFFNIYLTFTIALDATNSNPGIFRLLFSLPYAFLLIGLLIVWFNQNKWNNESKDEKEIFSLVWFSIVFGFIGFFSWMSDTYLCIHPFVSYLYLHCIWHISISYTTYCMITLISFIKAHNRGYHVRVNWYLKFIPTVTWILNKHPNEVVEMT